MKPNSKQGRTMQVNVAVASQQELSEWLALLRRTAHEVQTVKLQCYRSLSGGSMGRGSRGSSSRQQQPAQLPALASQQHRSVVAEASAKLASDKLRGQLPDVMCKAVSASVVRHLELAVKLPLKLYEQLGTCLASNASLEVISLAGSCCGDAALAAVFPALTHHSKLQVLELAGCCLSDCSAARLATLLRAQGAAAAQQAWVQGLRGGSSSSAAARGHAGDSSLGPACIAQGLQVMDVAHNQITAASLAVLAAALTDEHSSLRHLSLASNQLPGAAAAAASLLQALMRDPPSRSFTVDLRGNFGENCGENFEVAPTLPELGVWAGMFAWNNSGSTAASGKPVVSSGGFAANNSRRRSGGSQLQRVPGPEVAAQQQCGRLHEAAEAAAHCGTLTAEGAAALPSAPAAAAVAAVGVVGYEPQPQWEQQQKLQLQLLQQAPASSVAAAGRQLDAEQVVQPQQQAAQQQVAPQQAAQLQELAQTHASSSGSTTCSSSPSIRSSLEGSPTSSWCCGSYQPNVLCQDAQGAGSGPAAVPYAHSNGTAVAAAAPGAVPAKDEGRSKAAPQSGAAQQALHAYPQQQPGQVQANGKQQQQAPQKKQQQQRSQQCKQPAVNPRQGNAGCAFDAGGGECHDGLVEAVQQQQEVLQWLMQQQQEGAGSVDEGLLVELAMTLCGLSEHVAMLERMYNVNTALPQQVTDTVATPAPAPAENADEEQNRRQRQRQCQRQKQSISCSTRPPTADTAAQGDAGWSMQHAAGEQGNSNRGTVGCVTAANAVYATGTKDRLSALMEQAAAICNAETLCRSAAVANSSSSSSSPASQQGDSPPWQSWGQQCSANCEVVDEISKQLYELHGLC